MFVLILHFFAKNIAKLLNVTDSKTLDPSVFKAHFIHLKCKGKNQWLPKLLAHITMNTVVFYVNASYWPIEAPLQSSFQER